ncbi:sodium:solute symporter family protein [Edaphobacillus lindanitolerans]|uniref:Solute:Na+ symporter, SSS family n=1 Tax=Edaphobacillus lindanitolerans TaxID=550447 RepID=A0A1U7PIG9_9BACI|nr:sodium:solute symporter family protein [Edaphobacillus lindanitolerans]SIT73820.1 solute:Na+ symporter, SSS family [Edaphobacillus lindanitolerans]
MSFNSVFLLFFVAFIAVLLAGGWVTRKWVTGSNDYFIAGREVGLLVNIFGVAAIGFAGTIITLGPGLAIMTGFWGSFGFGLIYGIGGLALYGLLFAPYIRRSGAHTLSEWLEMRFDKRTRTLVTVATILGLLGIMANNVMSMAIVTTSFTGWSLIGTLSAIFAMFLLFTYIGGFWAVTLTDFVQMCIGLIALPVMLITIISKFGGMSFIGSNWAGPGSYWTSGIGGGQLPVLSLQYPSVLTFGILFACFLVWGNNYYWLRVSSTRSERTAKLSFVYGALLLVFVPILILAFTGLYAGSAMGDQFLPYGTVDPTAAFGVVLKALPIVVAAFALLGALAASISTSTTALIGASSTAVRDLYQRYVRPNATSKELTVPSKLITLALGLIVWLLCFYPGGPLYLFAFSTAWLGAPSILVFLGMWWKRTTKTGAFYGAVVGISATAVFTVLDLTKVFPLGAYTHVGVVGLIATVLTTVIISLLTKPDYYALKGFDGPVGPTGTLTEEEKKVMTLIHYGYDTMAEISDMLGVDSSVSNKIIENLDKRHLIGRKKYSGPGFYTFHIQKGLAPELFLKGSSLHYSDDQLTGEDFIFLQKLRHGMGALNQYIRETGFDSLHASAILSKLIKQGFLIEKGLWRRQVILSPQGNGILQKYSGISGPAPALQEVQ